MCAFRFDSPATSKFTGDIDGNAYQSVVWGGSDDFVDRAVRHEERRPRTSSAAPWRDAAEASS
jgi:hypothetical protein